MRIILLKLQLSLILSMSFLNASELRHRVVDASSSMSSGEQKSEFKALSKRVLALREKGSKEHEDVVAIRLRSSPYASIAEKEVAQQYLECRADQEKNKALLCPIGMLPPALTLGALCCYGDPGGNLGTDTFFGTAFANLAGLVTCSYSMFACCAWPALRHIAQSDEPPSAYVKCCALAYSTDHE